MKNHKEGKMLAEMHKGNTRMMSAFRTVKLPIRKAKLRLR